MIEIARRTFLRRIGTALVGLGSGCTGFGSHHGAHIAIYNEDTSEHTVTVVLAREEGNDEIRRRTTVRPDGSVRFENAIPNPGDEVHAYAVEVSLETGVTETSRIELGEAYGFHQLAITVEPGSTVVIEPQVH